MKAVTAVRGNAIPRGGVGALQAVQPIATPQDIARLVDEMTPAISAFRAASTPQTVPLDAMTFTNAELGQTKQVRIANVGLGFAIRSVHSVVINIANAGAGAQTVNVSPHFPFNLITNTAIQINGGETSYSVSGRSGIFVWARDRRGYLMPQPGGAGLNAALQVVTSGANLTPTAAAAGAYSMSGVASISVALTSNGNLTCTFVTYEKLAHGRDTLLGALPLQNNQTYATLSMGIVGSLVSTVNQAGIAPFFNAGANITATITSWSTTRRYMFWGIPSDPGLYQDLVRNSYQVIEQKGLSFNATGADAIKYPVPSNLYLEALHFMGQDGNNAFLTTPTALPVMKITYNAGSIIPVATDAGGDRGQQYADYGADVMAYPGYRLWDGDNTSDSMVLTDDSGWLDTYSAAEPAWQFDVLAGTVTPITATVTRECLVAGSVQQVGG